MNNKVDDRLIYDIQYMRKIMKSAKDIGKQTGDVDKEKCFEQLLESLFHIEVIVTQHLDKERLDE